MSAIAPSNSPLANPQVLHRGTDENGANLIRGLRHLVEDLERSNGRFAPNMTQASEFRVGDVVCRVTGAEQVNVLGFCIGGILTTATLSFLAAFVLGGSGHIAGIINPPSKSKYGYWVGKEYPAAADDWLAQAGKTDGSWWPLWAKWIEQHGGDKNALYRPCSDGVNSLGEAPGTYVLG
jgi:poly(3-hydroxyalkanoate) synthetase